MSNKNGLGTTEEYAAGFKPDEKYQSVLSDSDGDVGKFVNGTLYNFDKIAHANGLTLAQANAIKPELFKMLEDIGVVDTRTPEEKSAAILTVQKQVLGDQAEEIVKRNVEFIKDYGVFSAKEKEMLTAAATQGNPYIVSVIDKIRILFGKGNSSDIPASSPATGLPSDDKWLEEYSKATPAEKVRMAEERNKLGGKKLKL
jgi:hypothetical protein